MRLAALVASHPAPEQLVPSPLPPRAFTWYMSGGCWSLALALRDATGLPIELYVHDGRPTHAYVVDGEYAIDARGRNPLRLVRAGAESLEEVAGADEIAERLADVAPELDLLLSDVEVRACAERAARLILDER